MSWWTAILGPARPTLRLLGRPPPPPAWPEDLERVGGHPLLRLRGTDRDRGRAPGRVLGPQVDHLLRHYLEPFVGPEAGRFARLARRMEPYLEPGEREEIEGIAEGAGEPYERLLVGNTFLDAHRAALCSSVVVRDDRSGRVLFGRNLDFVSFGVAHRLGVVFVHEPPGEIPFLTVGWPGLLGAVTGMNREGLTVALNLVYGEEDADEGTPVTFALQRALRRARDVDGAVEVLRGVRFASSNNLTVVDAGGDASVLEVGPRRFHRRDLADGTLLATNHFASCRARPRPTPISLSSHLRFLVLRRFRRALVRRPDRQGVRRALRRVAVPGITLQSFVFDPGGASMELSMGRVPAARGRFVRFDARRLWAGSP